jgi:hypothetical protein
VIPTSLVGSPVPPDEDAGCCVWCGHGALNSCLNQATVDLIASSSGVATHPKVGSNLLLSTTHGRSEW